MASKYIHDSLRLIIYTNIRKHASIITAPITPPTSPKIPITASIIENITTALNINNNTPPPSSSSSDDNNSQKVPITTATTTPIPTPAADNATASDDTITTQKNESVPAAATNPIPQVSDKDRNLRIARMEQEFLFFLNYDLSVQDPSLLVKWAQSYESPEENKPESDEAYTSADEGDDEMDDDEER